MGTKSGQEWECLWSLSPGTEGHRWNAEVGIFEVWSLDTIAVSVSSRAPVWKSEECTENKVLQHHGSLKEIERSSELSGGWIEWAGLWGVNLSLGRFAGRVLRAS